jgi:hypothetical protein
VRILASVRMIDNGAPSFRYDKRHRLFIPRTLLEKAVLVGYGLSRAQGGLETLGSVRPKIWSVSSSAGRDIWKLGAVGGSASLSEISAR